MEVTKKMDKINYTLLELNKYNDNITDLIEFSLVEFKYDKEKIKSAFNDLYYEYEVGFIDRTLKSFFKKPSQVKKSLKKLFSYYLNNRKLERMISKNNIKQKVKYLNAIKDSHDCIHAIMQMIIDKKGDKSKINSKIMNLEKTCSELNSTFLCFASLNLLGVTFKLTGYKNIKAIYSNNEIKELLKIIIYCQKRTYGNEKISAIFDDSFNLFINKKYNKVELEKNFIEIYNSCSKACVELENLKTELFNSFAKEALKELEKTK